MNLATIVTIKELRAIKDADKIELAFINENDWQCVVKRGEFKIGDMGVYFVIDTLVDSTNPALGFMAARKNKVWAAKFKNEFSAGLLMPVSILNYWGEVPVLTSGLDLTEFTKTQKYVKAEDLSNNLNAAGSFPSHLVSKTDEENLLSNKACFDELKGEQVTITVKQDGSSSTFLYDENGDFCVCSRNLKLKPELDNAWTRMANKYNLAQVLFGTSLAIQAECVGPKLNGNKLGLAAEDLFVFDVWDTKTRKACNYNEIKDFCALNGLKPVPLVWQGVFNFNSVDELVEMANGLKYENGSPAEGIVIRVDNGKFSSRLGGRLSVKVISREFMLKNKI